MQNIHNLWETIYEMLHRTRSSGLSVVVWMLKAMYIVHRKQCFDIQEILYLIAF